MEKIKKMIDRIYDVNDIENLESYLKERKVTISQIKAEQGDTVLLSFPDSHPFRKINGKKIVLGEKHDGRYAIEVEGYPGAEVISSRIVKIVKRKGD